jgi:hypothetical protein
MDFYCFFIMIFSYIIFMSLSDCRSQGLFWCLIYPLLVKQGYTKHGYVHMLSGMYDVLFNRKSLKSHMKSLSRCTVHFIFPSFFIEYTHPLHIVYHLLPITRIKIKILGQGLRYHCNAKIRSIKFGFKHGKFKYKSK